MFILNKDIVEDILNSNNFSDSFKDVLVNYADRELSEREVNEFLTVLSYAILDGRRIRTNVLEGMLSNDRINTLNTMLEGIRRSNNNNTLTDSDINYVRNTLLRNFIVDNSPTMQRTETETINPTSTAGQTTQEGPEVSQNEGIENITNMNQLREALNRVVSELDSQTLSIGLVRLREINNELASLHQINLNLQSQARFNGEIDDNELREILVFGDDLWYQVAHEMDRVNQMLEIKERLQESKTEQISQEEVHRNDINNLLSIDRNHLAELQRQIERVSDESARRVIQTSISQTQERITSEENLLNERSTRLENLRAQIETLSNGGSLEELSTATIVDRNITREDPTIGETRTLMGEYDEILRRLEGRELSEIGLEELNAIRADLVDAHNLNQELQNRNRYNQNIDINELRNTLVRGEEIWQGVGTQIASIDREIETKNNLLNNYNDELDSTRENIQKQEQLIEDLRKQISQLEEIIGRTTDPSVLESYRKSLEALRKSLQDQEELLNQLKELLNETNAKIDKINKGGKIDSRSEQSTTEEETVEEENNRGTNIVDGLSPRDQLLAFRNKYDEIMSRLNGRNLDEIGIIELSQIRREFEQLHKDNLSFIEKVRFDGGIDTVEYSELLEESNKLYEDIRVSMIPPYEKLQEKVAIARELLERKNKIKISIKSIERLINERTKILEELKKDLEKTTDPEVRKNYEETIKSIEKELEGYNKQLEDYNKEIEKIDKIIDILRKGGPYRDLLKDDKKEKEDDKEKVGEKEKAGEKDEDSTKLPAGIPRPTPKGLGPNMLKQPNVKYNKPKLTWKTALAVAAGVGIGATVFFTTGPTGVAVMSVVSGIANKFVSSARAKAAANRMNILGGEVEVEEVEEPKKGIKGAIERFKKYIKSEEGLRDISWMLMSAIITGNALSIGSAIRAKMIASQAPDTPPVEPTPPTETPQSVEPTPTIEPSPVPVNAPTDTVYSGIRLGDNVGNYNVSVGHTQATKAFGGWDPLHLNQNLVNSDSVFSEFAIVDDSGKLIQRISTPGLSLDEVCAQYGVNYSNVVLDVTKGGTAQAWISVEELVNGVTMGGPTV